MTLTDFALGDRDPGPPQNPPTELAWVFRRIWPAVVKGSNAVHREGAVVRRRLAAVGAAALRVAGRRDDVATAAASTSDARSRLDHEPGHPRGPYDGPSRVVSTKLYVVLMIAVAALAYNVDRGALLVLLLPLDLTRAIALGTVVLQLIGTHYGGHLLRRRHDAVHPVIRGRSEWALAVLCLTGAYGLAVVLAVIRAIGTGWLPGLLFLVLGVLDMTVAVVASYLYTHDGLSALERARRHERVVQWRHARSERRLRRRVARALRSYDRLRLAALRVVLTYRQGVDAAVDLWRRNHPGHPFPHHPEPELIVRLDRLAADTGGGQRQVNVVLTQAGVTLEELAK